MGFKKGAKDDDDRYSDGEDEDEYDDEDENRH